MGNGVAGWMSPQIIIAVIGLIVAAIVGPWIKKRFFDPAHHLRVTIDANSYLERAFLVKLLKEDRDKAIKKRR